MIHLRLRRKEGACPVDSLVRMAALRDFPRGIAGVRLDTFLVGRQYSVELDDPPQGAPVLLSFHFSFCHLFSEAPAADFRTEPCALRHLAVACAARADHFP